MIELEGTLWLPLSSNHGDIVALISPDEKGLILETYRYNAFGEYVMTLSFSQYYYGQNPWRFQSKRLDLETNWIHFGSRDYSPELGRWMTPDPAGFVDSVNLYQYLYNNPHKYVDPKGKFIFLIAPLFTLSFGVGAATFVLPTVTVLAQVTASAIIAYGTYELINAVNDQRILNQLSDPDTLLEEEEKKNKKPKAPYQNLPNDPEKCPADGFEWRGGKDGAWFNPETKESLHPDFDHPDHEPHWDYVKRNPREEGRIYFDNTYELK